MIILYIFLLSVVCWLNRNSSDVRTKYIKIEYYVGDTSIALSVELRSFQMFSQQNRNYCTGTSNDYN